MQWKHSLNLIEKLSESSEYIQTLFKELGLDRWAYQNTALDSNVETNYPQRWVERYISQNYFSIDPVIKHAESYNIPFIWEENGAYLQVSHVVSTQHSPHQLQLSKQQLHFFEEAKSYNIEYGLIIPIDEETNNASYAFAPESIPKEEMSKWCCDNIEYLDFICNVNYRLHKPRYSNKVLVTSKEREVLYWLSEGKSSWEVSKILNISERTVNFHTGNIKKKLKASNRSQMISAAFREKLIV